MNLVFSGTDFFLFVIMFLFFVFPVCHFLSHSLVYGGCQARGPIRAVATGLRQSHSNAGSEPRLQPTPQLMATPIPNPPSKGRDQTHNLMVPSWIR